jgi:hypothetical protein
MRTIMSRESGLRKRLLAEKEKEAESEIAAQRRIQDLSIEIMEEGLEKELAQMQLETERKIETLTGSEQQIAEQKRLLLENSLQEQQTLRDEYLLEQKEKQDAETKRQIHSVHPHKAENDSGYEKLYKFVIQKR